MEASSLRIPYNNKNRFYAELCSEISGILDSEWLMNFANFSALLKQHLPDVNWVGFYLEKEGALILGPFQGLPACTRIAFGKGVCGTAALNKKTLVVADVDQFPGHIVCDAQSRSEIVIPLIIDNKVVGVLDVDSPLLQRFDSEDQKGLEQAVQLLMAKTSLAQIRF